MSVVSKTRRDGRAPAKVNKGEAGGSVASSVSPPRQAQPARSRRACPTTVDELMARIAEEYDTLPPQLKGIASYVDQQRANLTVDRAVDVAARCAVHPSAVVRFAQRLGFSGFREIQAVFRHAYTEQADPNQNYQQRIRRLIGSKRGVLTGGAVAREFIAASRSGLDELARDLDEAQLDAAIALLQKAENIYVVGVRRSFTVASYIVYALQHTSKRVHLLSGLGGGHREQIASIRRNDVLIAISFTPYGKETQYCVRQARKQAASVLLISDSHLSPLARDVDSILTVQEGSAFAFRSLTSTLCLCQALFIALAYRLELNVEETRDQEGYDA